MKRLVHDGRQPRSNVRHEDGTARLVESAERIGIEIDREEAERWITAMSAESMAAIVGFEDRPPVVVKEMGGDSVAEYVARLTDEVYEYTVEAPNYGKAARRMYNIFRLTGRYPEAAYIRELFDEPVGEAFETDALVAQVDQLIMSAIAVLEGRAEAETVRRLLRLRDAVSHRTEAEARTDEIAGVGEDAMRAVNEYFERLLTAVPDINAYLESVAASRGVRAS